MMDHGLRVTGMSVKSRANTFFGFLAGVFLRVLGRSPAKPTPDDYRRAEFSSSTQRMGVRFTERIRGVFRFRWIRKKHG